MKRGPGSWGFWVGIGILLIVIGLALKYSERQPVGTPASSTSHPPTAAPTSTTDRPLAAGSSPTPAPAPAATSVPTPTPTTTPAHSPTPEANDQQAQHEWVQDAHDAQRSGYTAEEPLLPWRLIWTWNGPDENGGTGNHIYDAPPDARTVTGGAHLYAPAGGAGLYALSKRDGKPAWHFTDTGIYASPAYHLSLQRLYAGGENGLLYEIDPETGLALRTYSAGAPINKAILLTEEAVFFADESGKLHKVLLRDFKAAWIYEGLAPVATPPAYSEGYGLVVYCTEDFTVHAVHAGDGAPKWVVQPGAIASGEARSISGYWPVIAELHGLVFVRVNLGMNGLWSGPGEGNMYPGSSAETRLYLEENPHLINLFALSLEDGSQKFLPAVGFGGVETLVDGQAELEMGPVPVVRAFPDGTEVAYTHFRSGAGDTVDGRWDSHLGEMVLDDRTIPGLEAGDLRFIQFDHGYAHITDEQSPVTMAGSTLFHAHWGASESARLLDRSPGFGRSAANPIPAEPYPSVIRRIQACSHFDPFTHWTSCNLTLFDDGRVWEGPGWWVYWNVLDPPTPSRDAYSEGLLPRYTYVSDGLVVVEGNGGDLTVFAHSGQ